MSRMIACVLALAALIPVSPGARAQAETALPDTTVVAARLADPETRSETLMVLAAIMRLKRLAAESEGSLQADALEQEMAWLERLQLRFGEAEPRGPVLDPAAWLIYQKLQRQQLPAESPVDPTGGDLGAYLDAVFQRGNDPVAAAMLPELLWMVEAESTRFWAALPEWAPIAGDLPGQIAKTTRDWGDEAAPMGEPVLPASEDTEFSAEMEQLLSRLATAAVVTGPPDLQRSEHLRYRLLLALASLAGNARAQAVAQLRLTGLIDGLHEGRFMAFAQGLLTVAADLLLSDDGADAPVAKWLARHLPLFSATYAREFAAVDPRINSALAAAYEVVQKLGSGVAGPGDEGLGAGLADAVAQLALLVPDIEYYFDLPVRDSIAGSVEACIGMMARQDPGGRPAMTRELFDDCQASLVELADVEARAPSLAGDPDGPFGADELQREVAVTSVQRINYGLGYLHERYDTACTLPERSLPNPLEFATLATLMAWFAEQSPVYFQTPENEARLVRMQRIGAALVSSLAGQVDCISGSGARLNDPVSRGLADYREAMIELSSRLRDSVMDFRQRALAPGADIDLAADADQETAYRPDDVMIGPCDAEQICEMSAPLGSTRALLGLFPDSYLIADQSGFGDIQLCYENMKWIDRRAEPVRPDDDNVSNYYGRLSFDLKGRLVVGDDVIDAFSFRFTSPDEYHYLFAAASDEVLADGCPMEWVGTRIVTPMAHSRGGIVPDRLTYLAAPRTLPSRLLALNWDRGAEWRDWFITGLGVDALGPAEPPDVSAPVTAHLRSLYRREQAEVYQSMLHGETAGGVVSINRQLQELTTQKGLVRMLIMQFYPQSLIDTDAIRKGVAGHAGLLDEEIMRRLRQNNVPVARVAEIGALRLDGLRRIWRSQPEAELRMGSVASGLAHALMRLERLYQENFANPAPPEPLTAPENGTAQPSKPADG